jgi:predicted metalloendopeptidase
MIIGHEITHGFDDQGRHMNADGNMKDWWGNETTEKFTERTQCMIDQYSNLTFADMKLNGRLTLGENIADNGGIKISYNAWVRKFE